MLELSEEDQILINNIKIVSVYCVKAMPNPKDYHLESVHQISHC